MLVICKYQVSNIKYKYQISSIQYQVLPLRGSASVHNDWGIPALAGVQAQTGVPGQLDLTWTNHSLV